jgi:hypothetical protein
MLARGGYVFPAGLEISPALGVEWGDLVGPKNTLVVVKYVCLRLL